MADVPVVYYNRPLDSTAGTTINIDFSSELTRDYESEVPLLTLLNKLKSKAALTNEFKFAIGRRAPRTAVTTNTTSAGARPRCGRELFDLSDLGCGQPREQIFQVIKRVDPLPPTTPQQGVDHGAAPPCSVWGQVHTAFASPAECADVSGKLIAQLVRLWRTALPPKNFH